MKGRGASQKSEKVAKASFHDRLEVRAIRGAGAQGQSIARATAANVAGTEDVWG